MAQREDFITRGVGDLYLAGHHVGYLQDAKFGLESPVEKFETGFPKRTAKVVKSAEIMTFEAGLAEFSIVNLARATGNRGVVDVTGGNQTVAEAANELYTVRLDRTSGDLYIQLGPGPGIGKTFSAVTLKKGATALEMGADAGDDYTFDAPTGKVKFDPEGTNDVAEGDIILAAYTYIRQAGKRLDFGADSTLKDTQLHYVSTEPNGVITTHAVIWKGTPSGSFEVTQDADNWVVIRPVWEASLDSTRPVNPLGYLFQVENV